LQPTKGAHTILHAATPTGVAAAAMCCSAAKLSCSNMPRFVPQSEPETFLNVTTPQQVTTLLGE
jgi:hypothetical protein